MTVKRTINVDEVGKLILCELLRFLLEEDALNNYQYEQARNIILNKKSVPIIIEWDYQREKI